MIPKFITSPDPKKYLSGNYVVLDFETTNKDKGNASNKDNRLVYGYWYGPRLGSGHIYDLKSLEAFLYYLAQAEFMVAHGGKFELKWLSRYTDISKILMYDTLLAEYCLAGNRKWPLDLDSVAKKWTGIGKNKLASELIEAGVCPSDIPEQMLQEYCQQDVMRTLYTFQRQREEIFKNGLEKVLYIRCITTPMLAEIEMNGMFLDKELVRETYEQALREYQEVSKKLDAATGGINMASPQQVAKFLYGELKFEELKDRKGFPIRGKPTKAFPEGTPKTDEDTILALKSKNETQRSFLKLKIDESKLRRKITGYCQRFMASCGLPFTPIKDKEPNYDRGQGTSYLFGSLNQSVSGTHRLTSSNPNQQNLDRTLKKVVTARIPGWRMVSADYRQLEFRTAGVLAQDQQAYSDIINNIDIHTYTKDVLTDAGQPTNRQDAKAHTFKPLYGGTSGTDAERTYYKAFRAKYSGIDNLHDEWIREVLSNKCLRTITGLIFYWPYCEVQPSGYINDHQAIRNYPVQMFATADIAPIGAVLLWHELKARGLKSFIINVVHDSVLLEVSPDEIEIVRNLIEKCLSKDIVWFFKELIKFDINFPIEVEIKVNSNWDYEKTK